MWSGIDLALYKKDWFIYIGVHVATDLVLLLLLVTGTAVGFLSKDWVASFSPAISVFDILAT